MLAFSVLDHTLIDSVVRWTLAQYWRAACWQALSCSMYQPQMVKLPWFWFMQSVKLLMSEAHGPDASVALDWLYRELSMALPVWA